MNAKRIVTAVLLLFVVGSLAWFGVQEVRHARAVKAVQGSPAAAAAPEVPSAAARPSETQPPQGLPNAPSLTMWQPPQAPAAGPVTSHSQPEPPARVASTTPAATHRGSKVIVYYLHTTARCPSCLKIEAYTAAEVTGPLAEPLSAGRLEWKVLNVEEPKNEHFVEDYQLYTKSVVVSEIRDGKEVRWKRLDKVWDYLDDQQAFMKYVDEEVRGYLKDLS